MTKEKLQARITQLEQERDQLRNNLVAYEGAIQDNKFWLSELEKDEVVEQDNSEPSS